MKRLIVRWLFKGTPHVLEILRTEVEAKEDIRKWQEQPPTTKISGYDRENDRLWGFTLEEIAGVVTFDLGKVKEEQQKAEQQKAEQQRLAAQQYQQGRTLPPNYFGPSAS